MADTWNQKIKLHYHSGLTSSQENLVNSLWFSSASVQIEIYLMALNDYITRDASSFSNLKSLLPYARNMQSYIAGGVFKDIFQKQTYKDIDIFFENEKAFLEYKNQIIRSNNYSSLYNNQNALGFYNSNENISIDLVQKKFGDPLEILESFDFSVSKFCLYREEYNYYKVIYHKHFFEDLVNRTLRFDSSKSDPVSQLSRVIRYSRYGFKINKSDYLNLLKRINEMTPDIFEDLSMDEIYSYY